MGLCYACVCVYVSVYTCRSGYFQADVFFGRSIAWSQGLYVAAGREPLKKVSYQAWKAAQEAPNSPTKRAATQLSMTSPPRNGLAAGSKTSGSPAKTTGSSPRTKGPAGKISSGGKFDKVEKEFSSLLGPGQAKKLKAMWKRIDYNGNNIVSR